MRCEKLWPLILFFGGRGGHLRRNKSSIFMPPYVRHWKTKFKSWYFEPVLVPLSGITRRFWWHITGWQGKNLQWSSHRFLDEYCGPNAGQGKGSVEWIIIRISLWERHCLLPDAALPPPLCWKALWCRNRISRMATTCRATGLCQTAAERHAHHLNTGSGCLVWWAPD